MDSKSIVLSIILGIFASQGFWAFISTVVQRKNKKDSAVARMLIGLGHDRICNLATYYISRGSISREEYESLHNYLFVPYKELGGDGTADKLMNEVEKLPTSSGGNIPEWLSQTAI